MKLNEYDLNKLHVFRILAESGSMRIAGAKLLRTPSAISQSLTSLEKILNVKLFHRVGRRLVITEPGKQLLVQIRKNESALETVLVNLQSHSEGISGTVALGLPSGFSARSFAGPLSELLNSHPEVQLRLRFMAHPRLAIALRSGGLDLAISFQPLNDIDAKIWSKEIRKEHLVLIASGRNPSAFIESKDLSRLDVVEYYQKPLLIEQWARHHRIRIPRNPNIRVYAATLENVLEFVRNGIGAAVVPRNLIEAEIASGAMQEHPLDRKRHLNASVWINMLHGRSQDVRSPIAIVRKILES